MKPTYWIAFKRLVILGCGDTVWIHDALEFQDLGAAWRWIIAREGDQTVMGAHLCPTDG